MTQEKQNISLVLGRSWAGNFGTKETEPSWTPIRWKAYRVLKGAFFT